MVISSKRRKPSIRFCIKLLYTTWFKFLYIKFLFIHQVLATMEIISQASCMYIVMYCSLAKSGRLICIARSWKFRFVMITSVRAKLWDLLITLAERLASLDLSKCLFKDRLLGLRRMAVLLHKVAAGKATVDRDFLHHFCIISCVKPHYFTFCIPFRVPFRIPAFRLSQLPVFKLRFKARSTHRKS